MANMIRNREVEDIRKLFNVTNDLTPEEEEQIRLENEWYVQPFSFVTCLIRYQVRRSLIEKRLYILQIHWMQGLS